MPYIKEENRVNLNDCIESMVQCLKANIQHDNEQNPGSDPKNRVISNEEFLSICGDINYSFSRILGGIMGDVSYPKIATITGVLENIKQEFYRRIAEKYENDKIIANGDIPEYRRRS